MLNHLFNAIFVFKITYTSRKKKYYPKKDKYVVSYEGEYNHITIPKTFLIDGIVCLM